MRSIKALLSNLAGRGCRFLERLIDVERGIFGSDFVFRICGGAGEPIFMSAGWKEDVTEFPVAF